jgi:benzil reductase ((S)-benzoin forming)
VNKYYITGSSSGLGRALVDILILNENNRITGISRSNDLEHPCFTHCSIDFFNPQELVRQVDSIFEDLEDFDHVYLINNAGYLGPIKYLGEMKDEEFERIYHVNLVAPAILSNAFIRKYKHFKGGKLLLNISSGASTKPYDGWAGYCSSKAALEMLSKVVAIENEIRGYDFKVISLAPGVIDTDMQQQVRNTSPSDFSNKERFVRLKDENKLLSPEQAAQNIIRFLGNTDLHQEVVQDIRKIGYV